MSQTETLMLVALGFALALLVVLLFGRGFWAIATNFGAKRKADNIPVQMLELQADRDRLRAEHAIMSRKLELRLDEIKSRMTEQMAEVSRSRNRVQTLIEQLEASQATVASRDREVAGLMAQVEGFKSDIESANASLNSLKSDINQKNLEITKLAQSVSQLTISLREKNSMLASLAEDSKTNLQVSQAAMGQPHEAEFGVGRIKKRITELTSISTEMDEEQHTNVQAANGPVVNMKSIEPAEFATALEHKLDDGEREVDPLTRDLKAIEAALHSKLISPYPAPTPVKPSTKANIISLTQRIRALQSDKS